MGLVSYLKKVKEAVTGVSIVEKKYKNETHKFFFFRETRIFEPLSFFNSTFFYLKDESQLLKFNTTKDLSSLLNFDDISSEKAIFDLYGKPALKVQSTIKGQDITSIKYSRRVGKSRIRLYFFLMDDNLCMVMNEFDDIESSPLILKAIHHKYVTNEVISESEFLSQSEQKTIVITGTKGKQIAIYKNVYLKISYLVDVKKFYEAIDKLELYDDYVEDPDSKMKSFLDYI